LSDLSLAPAWAALRPHGRAALIPYITAGFPDAEATRAFLAGAAAAGADLIELGVPWSDPVADGPVIQASSHASLAGGTTLASVLDLLAASRPRVPVILFSYLNPLLAFGPERFAERAREAGAAGILVTDLPVGADPGVEARLRSSGLPLVRLVAPTSTPQRLRVIAAASEGFVYLVARLGVTGRGTGAPGHGGTELAERIAAVRAVTTLPVVVGFGISEPADAARVAKLADGVVVGSALVERMRVGGAPAGLAWLRELRNAMDAARRAA
jgi:tryptophan synthase alpha chain